MSSCLLFLVSAVAGSDYDMATMDVSFSVGSSSGDMECLNINITDDHVLEGDETFTVTIVSYPSSVVPGNVQSIVSIIDNEG